MLYTHNNLLIYFFFLFFSYGLIFCIMNQNMDALQLQHQWLDFISALFHEGVLNEQFTQLQYLQDAGNPNFLIEIVSLFFEESERRIGNLFTMLNQQVVDFKKVCEVVCMFKGSSVSIGIPRVTNACSLFGNCCKKGYLEGCLESLQELMQEYYNSKSKLKTLLSLGQQIVAAGGSVPKF